MRNVCEARGANDELSLDSIGKPSVLRNKKNRDRKKRDRARARGVDGEAVEQFCAPILKSVARNSFLFRISVLVALAQRPAHYSVTPAAESCRPCPFTVRPLMGADRPLLGAASLLYFFSPNNVRERLILRVIACAEGKWYSFTRPPVSVPGYVLRDIYFPLFPLHISSLNYPSILVNIARLIISNFISRRKWITRHARE